MDGWLGHEDMIEPEFTTAYLDKMTVGSVALCLFFWLKTNAVTWHKNHSWKIMYQIKCTNNNPLIFTKKS